MPDDSETATEPMDTSTAPQGDGGDTGPQESQESLELLGDLAFWDDDGPDWVDAIVLSPMSEEPAEQLPAVNLQRTLADALTAVPALLRLDTEEQFSKPEVDTAPMQAQGEAGPSGAAQDPATTHQPPISELLARLERLSFKRVKASHHYI